MTYNEKYLPENPSGSVEYTLTPPGVSSMEGALDFRGGEPSALHTDNPDAPSNPLSSPCLFGATTRTPSLLIFGG